MEMNIIETITTFTVVESAGVARDAEAIIHGVPLAQGKVYSGDSLAIKVKGNLVPCFADKLVEWPDKSFRWVEICFLASTAPNEEITIELVKLDVPLTLPAEEQVQVKSLESLVLANSHLNISFCENDPAVYFGDHDSPRCYRFNYALRDKHGKSVELVSKGSARVDSQNSFYARVSQNFMAGVPGTDLDELNIGLVLTLFANTSQVHVELKLHNPKAAAHPGGFWELGDAGSIDFSSFSFLIERANEFDVKGSKEPVGSYWIESNTGMTQVFEGDSVNIYQESSGLDNWSSANHINKSGQLPLTFQGYKVSVNGNLDRQGKHAQPMVGIDSELSCVVAMKQFWQNFPKSCSLDRSKIEFGVFPNEFPDSFELQGGESKTHVFRIAIGNQVEELFENLDAQLNAPLYAQQPFLSLIESSALPYPISIENPVLDEGLQKYIDNGLDGDNNFYSKRDQIDEFGWRNFGDLYADHEKVHYEGSDTLISHYNNQYDAVFGFLNQYSYSRDKRWLELASDLARHIVDIDIYNTDRDRAQYNHGLFWHTDHYLNAYTCTHRTFCRQHLEVDHVSQSGGGPGSEHCYSTGLAYFYLMTGKVEFKKAVLGLNSWLSVVMDGTDTVLETLVRFLKNDLKKLKDGLTGRAVDRFVYPLTRATGHYINSCLDVWLVTSDQQHLEKAYEIIFCSAHPQEDIAHRSLENIEKSWSYVMFLQAVCRFIYIKESNEQFDEGYEYAKMTLLHYARWMASNEYPYLDKPDVLEYPNYTWTAQDVRKVSVLNFASRYVEEDEAESFQSKAEEIKLAVYRDAPKSDESTFTRFMVILMQNPIYTVQSSESVRESKLDDIGDYRVGIGFIFMRSVKLLLKRLVKMNVKEEYSWLKNRLKAS